MKTKFERFGFLICLIAFLYFSIHILIYLHSVIVVTTAFWMVVRFTVALIVGTVCGFVILAMVANGKMEDARRAIYSAASGNTDGCKQFVKEGR